MNQPGRECRNCLGDGWVRIGRGIGRQVECRACGGSRRVVDFPAALSFERKS